MLLQDLRQAFRQLRKSPGFAVLAVLTLAFGIGANTAMFTVVESVLLSPLPYTHPSRLVSIGLADNPGGSTSWLNYRDIHDQSKTLDQVAGFSDDIGVVEGKTGSLSVTSPAVTPNLFSMLGVQPMLGRTFTTAEGQTGGPQVMLLSEGLWREDFHADPGILNQTVRVNGQPRTVIGVMPRSFRFPELTGNDMTKGIWLPLQPTSLMEKDRGYHFFLVVAQVRPGVSFQQVQADLDRIARNIRSAEPKDTQGLGFTVSSYAEKLTGPVRPVFLGLVAGLALVLLIACANVANLMIARCLSRQQEFAVRAALGAPRSRLARQTVVEGGVVSALGCLFGFFLAWLMLAGVHRLPQGTIPRAEAISLHWNIALILAVIATITTVLSSLLPALLVAKTNPQRALQAASRGLGARSVNRRLSGTLVAGEVALSALLLISAGLLFRTLWNLEHTRLGFDITRITEFSAMPADATGFGNMAVSQDTAHAPASVALLVYQPVLERLRQLPGVRDAALITAPPLSGIEMGTSFRVLGQPEDEAHKFEARMTAVSDGYAHLMGTPIVAGRMVGDQDAATSPFAVVINQALAQKYFAGKNPLGQQIDLGGKDTGMLKPYTIVGVLGDEVDRSVAQAPQPLLLLPMSQVPTTSLFYPALLKTIVNFVVKTRGDIAVAPAARAVFRQLAPDYALDNFQTMQEAVDHSNFANRLGLYLTAAFAGLAVLMVVAGLYGVLAQLVSYRRREIGVRLALGSTREGVLRIVLRQGTLLVAAGLAVGVVLAIATGRLLKSFLYGVQPSDFWTYASVILLLLAVGSAASLLPALRAASIQPMEALRDE